MMQVPENFSKLHEDPEQGHPKMKQYPSTRFLEEAEPWMLARYCNFLLQSVMMLTRVFRVPKKLSEIYGLGCSSAARLALLMMRTMQLQNPEAMQLKTVRRHLYARMLQESDDREQIQQTTKQEWAEDRLTNLNGRLDEFLLSHVCPGILEGRYPKTNLEADMAKQWDDVWKVPSIRVFNLPIARDSSTCETDTSNVGLCSKTVVLDVRLKFLKFGGDILTISLAEDIRAQTDSYVDFSDSEWITRSRYFWKSDFRAYTVVAYSTIDDVLFRTICRGLSCIQVLFFEISILLTA